MSVDYENGYADGLSDGHKDFKEFLEAVDRLVGKIQEDNTMSASTGNAIREVIKAKASIRPPTRECGAQPEDSK